MLFIKGSPLWRLFFQGYKSPFLAYFVEKLVIEIGVLAGLSSKRGLHSG